jgi:hypothetical protein
MSVVVLAVVFALAGAGAFALRVTTAFLAAVRPLRGAAAFFAAPGGLRVFAAFLAAGRDFRVFAAFFAADFFAADFDLAMFTPQSVQGVELLRRTPRQPLTCCSMNSTMCPNMGPHFARSGDEPGLRSMSMYSSAIEPPALA